MGPEHDFPLGSKSLEGIVHLCVWGGQIGWSLVGEGLHSGFTQNQGLKKMASNSIGSPGTSLVLGRGIKGGTGTESMD